MTKVITSQLVSKFLCRLDKIIELLELRNGIEVARDEMRRGEYSESPFTPFKQYPTGTDWIGNCVCGNHKTGELTAGWWCPVHASCH